MKTIILNNGRLGNAMLFAPGAMLLAAAFLVLLAPKLVAVLLAAFLFYVGATVLFLTWKFTQFRRRMGAFLNNVPRIVVTSHDADRHASMFFSGESDTSETRTRTKRVILH